MYFCYNKKKAVNNVTPVQQSDQQNAMASIINPELDAKQKIVPHAVENAIDMGNDPARRESDSISIVLKIQSSALSSVLKMSCP